jgi:hypothetical protein
MHSMSFTLNGKNHVVAGDYDSLLNLADALGKARDIPSKIVDMSTKAESYQHTYKKGDRVWYAGEMFKVVAPIPGIDVIEIAPLTCDKACCNSRVTSRQIDLAIR